MSRIRDRECANAVTSKSNSVRTDRVCVVVVAQQYISRRLSFRRRAYSHSHSHSFTVFAAKAVISKRMPLPQKGPNRRTTTTTERGADIAAVTPATEDTESFLFSFFFF